MNTNKLLNHEHTHIEKEKLEYLNNKILKNINKLQVLKIIKKYLKNYDLEYKEFEISIDKSGQKICI